MDKHLLIIPLKGKIDSLNANDVNQEITRQRNTQKHQKLVFDAEELSANQKEAVITQPLSFLILLFSLECHFLHF